MEEAKGAREVVSWRQLRAGLDQADYKNLASEWTTVARKFRSTDEVCAVSEVWWEKDSLAARNLDHFFDDDVR